MHQGVATTLSRADPACSGRLLLVAVHSGLHSNSALQGGAARFNVKCGRQNARGWAAVANSYGCNSQRRIGSIVQALPLRNTSSRGSLSSPRTRQLQPSQTLPTTSAPRYSSYKAASRTSDNSFRGSFRIPQQSDNARFRPSSWSSAAPQNAQSALGSVARRRSMSGFKRSAADYGSTSSMAGLDVERSGVSSASKAARQPAVALITTSGCQYCAQAKSQLDAAGLAYEEIELSSFPKLLSEVKAATGRQSVPQVFLGGLLIGGADELSAALAEGSFQDALDGNNEPALPADLRQSVDRARASAPKPSVPRPLLPEGMSEERYSHLQYIATKLGKGLLPKGNRMFTLAEGGEWLRRARVTPTPEAGLGLLSDLQRAHLLYVSDTSAADLATVEPGMGTPPRASTALQLVADAPHAAWGEALNVRVPWYGEPHPASQVADGLRTLILGLYDKHLAMDGRGVDYPALAHDPAFRDYVVATSELQKVELTDMDRNEMMAFFINVYNALVVHGMVLFGPAESTLKRLQWFGQVRYNIGGMDFSCNDIEHGVLRGNAASPASIGVLLGKPLWSSPTFKQKDPRARLAISPMDKRIHFALVCGAKSCPPIRVYTPGELEEGLEAAAGAFCESEVEIMHESRVIMLSSIFKWYSVDFGPPDELLPWLLQYLPDGPAAELEDLLAHLGPSQIKIKYREYDWSLNNSGDQE